MKGPTVDELAVTQADRALLDAHYARVTELLEANNRYLERARAAERELAEANQALEDGADLWREFGERQP